MVAGCESSALTDHDLTPNKEWASLPGWVIVCNVHKDELAEPDAEWLLDRDTRTLYLGDSLRQLNEYILVEPPREIRGYGAGREFSNDAEDGHHIPLRVRRRGEKEPKDIVVVLTSKELNREFKELVELLP
jgi:hypothetical protein